MFGSSANKNTGAVLNYLLNNVMCLVHHCTAIHQEISHRHRDAVQA